MQHRLAVAAPVHMCVTASDADLPFLAKATGSSYRRTTGLLNDFDLLAAAPISASAFSFLHFRLLAHFSYSCTSFYLVSAWPSSVHGPRSLFSTIRIQG